MTNEEPIKPECWNCVEWEWFDDHGYGCFCMQTMNPIDAANCECYRYDYDKRFGYDE